MGRMPRCFEVELGKGSPVREVNDTENGLRLEEEIPERASEEEEIQ